MAQLLLCHYIVFTELVMPCPASCKCRLCSWDSSSKGYYCNGVAYKVTYKDSSLSTAIYCEGNLPPSHSFPCINQPGNNVSFGRPLTLKSFYNTAVSYKISWNRILATTGHFSIYHLHPSQFTVTISGNFVAEIHS